MVDATAPFVMSIESECLTATPDNPGAHEKVLGQLLAKVSGLIPSLPATAGVFTGYGRLYADVGHLEIALCELESPYLVPVIFERVQTLVGQVVAQLAEEGHRLILANNNHSGLLTADAPTWGTHENYLVERHPTTFAPEILPFLVTRIYGGAGGVWYPSGAFLAGVRPLSMSLAVGGSTTELRAIHSTARDENHMGPAPNRYRYHLILGDGHRSHFNLALQLGATALAVRAAVGDRRLRQELSDLRGEFSEDWVASLRKFNILAAPGQPLRVDPLVIRTQRLYLAGAERYASRLANPPGWIPRLLGDWQDTLDACERMDRAWLSTRLDAFIKYELYDAVLAAAGGTWAGLPARPQLFHELALLDHSYHEFTNPNSIFQRLEVAGVLHHRVGPRITPGAEPEPFVPETTTRARARARFIREHQDSNDLMVDWSFAENHHSGTTAWLDDPFAQEFSVWRDEPTPELAPRLQPIYELLLRGNYEAADRALRMLELGRLRNERARRYRLWLVVRRGQRGAELLHNGIHRRRADWPALADHCFILRYQGFRPPLERAVILQRQGSQLLTLLDGPETVDIAEYREQIGAILLRHGRLTEALSLLESAACLRSDDAGLIRARGRILALLGEACRANRQLDRARDLLQQARQIQLEQQAEADLAFVTLPSLAKCAESPEQAVELLKQAEAMQVRNGDFLGHAQTLVLLARFTLDESQAAACHEQFAHYRSQVSALGNCLLAGRLVDEWDAWRTGTGHDAAGEYWGI